MFNDKLRFSRLRLTHWLSVMVFFLIWFSFISMVVWLASFPLQKQCYLRNRGQLTQATVVGAVYEDDPTGETGDRVDVQFMTSTGEQITVLRQALIPPGVYAVGDPVALRYDPQNPRYCLMSHQLDDPAPRRQSLLFLSIYLLILVSVLNFFFTQPA